MDIFVLGKFNAAYMDKFIASANKAAAIKDVEASFSSDKSDRTAMISTEVRSKEDVKASTRSSQKHAGRAT